MPPKPDLQPPPCKDALALALGQVDQLRARLAAAEIDAKARTAEADAARRRGDAAAAEVALGRATDDEADLLEDTAAAAHQAVHRAGRLARGLTVALRDAETAAAGLAEAAGVEMREWILTYSDSIQVRYGRAAASLLEVLREAVALGTAGGDELAQMRFFRIPKDFRHPHDGLLEIGSGDGQVPPIVTPASQIATETAMLIRRAERLGESDK